MPLIRSPRARLACAAALSLGAHAPAQTVTQDDRLFASVQAQAAGSAVAMTDTHIAMGTQQGNAVFLFDRATGQEVRVYPAPVAGRGFGFSVAMHADTLVIGAPGSAGVTGAAYIYNIATDQLVATLVAPAAKPGDDFGRSVAVHADRVLVAAPLDDTLASNAGACYLFRTNGQLLATITDPEGVAGDELGVTSGAGVAIGDQYALIGSARADRDALVNNGAAIVVSAADGQFLRRLAPDDPQAGGQFGVSVALSGSTGVVGANLHTASGVFREGSAYLFDLGTGDQLHRLEPPEPDPNEVFGLPVAIDDGLVLVGAQGDRVGGVAVGSAHLFRASDAGFIATLLASDAAPGEQFARGLHMAGGSAVVGAPLSNDDGSQSGGAYRYRLTAARIARQPGSLVAQPGVQADLDVAVENAGGVSYQWRHNGQPVSDGADYQGAQSPTLSIAASDATEGYYDCVISRDPLPPVTTDQAVLAVLPDPDACTADLNDDELINIFDIQTYIGIYLNGCP